jgi:hypothetical protein
MMLDVLEEHAELPHPPEEHELWQESIALVWYDSRVGIGEYLRIGHEPNSGGGVAVLGFGVLTREGSRYRRNVTSVLTDADRLANGFAARDGAYQAFYDAGLKVRVDDQDCHLEFELEDFYPRTDFFGAAAGAVRDLAPNHFETSGRIRGTAVLAGQRHEVDGLFHRDHSWGIRHWDSFLNHRWVVGSFGPELSFGLVTWHARDGVLRRFGYVVRNGELVSADDVDIVLHLEPDGTTYRGGTASWVMASDVLTLECSVLDAIVVERKGASWVDAICEIEHAGRTGFCCLEASTNPRAGTAPIQTALRAAIDDGVSRRD